MSELAKVAEAISFHGDHRRNHKLRRLITAAQLLEIWAREQDDQLGNQLAENFAMQLEAMREEG